MVRQHRRTGPWRAGHRRDGRAVLMVGCGPCGWFQGYAYAPLIGRWPAGWHLRREYRAHRRGERSGG